MKNKNERLKAMFGLSEDYINSLSDAEKEIYFVVRPARATTYQVNVRLSGVENHITTLEEDAVSSGGKLFLSPDFQRGHVWTKEKQIKYMENFLRKSAPNVLKFNCSSYLSSKESVNMNKGDIVCIDGLQRLTAMREFMADKFKVFDRYFASDLKKTPFDPSRYTFIFEMFDFDDKKELLQFYLDLNTGGVVHSDDEIEKVTKMLKDLE